MHSNFAVAFAVATLLAAALGRGQESWSGAGGDQGGGACTNCTICPSSCQVPAQPPPAGPDQPPPEVGDGWNAPPVAGTGLPGYPPPASNCPPEPAPACCQPQQNPSNNPNFSYYNPPPYNVPANGNELLKPFVFGAGLTGFLQFLVLIHRGF